MARHSWAEMCRKVTAKVANGASLSDFDGQELACAKWMIDRGQIESTPSGGTHILSLKGRAAKKSNFKYYELND